MFLAFIHRITRMISVTTVIREVGEGTRALLSRPAATEPAEADEPPHLAHQSVVTSPSSGYLDTVDQHGLVALAREHDVRLEVLHPLGTFLPEGAPVVLVHGDGPPARLSGSDLGQHGSASRATEPCSRT